MNPTRALRLIRELARHGRYTVLYHAQESMARSDVSSEDLDRALKQAKRCWLQTFNNRWKVLGADEDGDDLYVIVEIIESMLVVTMFRGDEE